MYGIPISSASFNLTPKLSFRSSKIAVIPFFITGGYDAWSYKEKTPKFFRNITVNFGEPFYPQAEKENDIANEIKEVVISLKK